MRLWEIEGIKPHFQTTCPECKKFMTFLQYADLAICCWPSCRATFETKWEGNDKFPSLVLKHHRSRAT